MHLCVTLNWPTHIQYIKARFNMVHVQNSTLAGGVAIGTTANLILQPWVAILIGGIAGTVSVLGYTFLTVSLRF